MHSDARFLQKILISVVALVVCASPAFASACTSSSNPCTNSSGSGSDSTDRATFNGGNSDLNFSNITFDGVTGTYTTTGLSAMTTDSLYTINFLGCLSSQTPCTSNSTLVDGNVANWDGGTDPALTGPNPVCCSTFDTITINLPAAVYAFAFDLLNANSYSNQAPFQVQITGGSAMFAATSVSLPGSVFYGYRSAAPITQVSIYAPNPNILLGLDNFEIGTQAPPVSEATTLLMVGSGLFMLHFARRRFS